LEFALTDDVVLRPPPETSSGVAAITPLTSAIAMTRTTMISKVLFTRFPPILALYALTPEK